MFSLLVVFNEQKLRDIYFQRKVVFIIKPFLSPSQLGGRSARLNEVKLWFDAQMTGKPEASTRANLGFNLVLSLTEYMTFEG